MTYFVCSDLDVVTYQCRAWVELTPELVEQINPNSKISFLSDMANLTFQDAQILLSFTALIFATAWIWRFLVKSTFK